MISIFFNFGKHLDGTATDAAHALEAVTSVLNSHSLSDSHSEVVDIHAMRATRNAATGAAAISIESVTDVADGTIVAKNDVAT